MADVVSPPQSFCGDAESCPGIRSGFIRSRSNEDSLFEASSVIAPESANPLSPISPVSSQLTSMERLELQKLRREVADLRTELAKGNMGNFDKGHERYRAWAEGWASAASAASTVPNSSPEGSTSRSSEVPSPSPGFSHRDGSSQADGSGIGRSQGFGGRWGWDWVLQERAYCFARDFFLDSPSQRTRGEFEAAVGEVPDIAMFFSEHFPRFFTGQQSEILDWNDFVQAYVQLCRKRKSMAEHEGMVCSAAATGHVSDVNEGRMRHQRPAALLTSQDYQGYLGVM